jgi:hypothetical protein
MAVEAGAAQPPDAAQATKNLVFTLSDGTKVKRRVPRQRAMSPAKKERSARGI